MVVAVVAMRVVQVPVHQVVDVITVRNGLVTAAGAMDVTGFVAITAVIRGAAVRIGVADLDHMFVDMIAVRMVQVAIVQVIHVTVVFHSGVAAAGAVVMIVVRVFLAAHQGFLPKE